MRQLTTKSSFAVIDIMKLFFALCVIAVHVWFLYDTKIGYYLYTMLYRIPVPFFFFASGYFLTLKLNEENTKINIINFIKKTVNVYLLLGTLYIFVNLVKSNDFSTYNLLRQTWQLIIGESWSIAWYLGATIISAIVLYFFNTEKKLLYSLKISLVLYIIGLLFNTYNFLIVDSIFNPIYLFLTEIFGNNSNFLFEGYIFFASGFCLGKYGKKLLQKDNRIYITFLFIGVVLLFLEVNLVKNNLDVVKYYEYYLSHLIIIPTIFILALKSKLNNKIKFNTQCCRKLSTYLFYFHPLILEVLLLYRTYKTGTLLDNNSFYYIIITIITIVLSFVYMKITNKNKDINILCFILYLFSLIIILFYMSVLHNKTFQGKIDLLSISKLCSFIPLIIIIIFALTKIKKTFGNFTSSIFIFFIVGMPLFMQYYSYINIYSWAMCLITISFLYLYDIFSSNQKKDWCKFLICTIIASKIHIYSAIFIAITYLALIVYFALMKKKQSLKKSIIYLLIILLMYLPSISSSLTYISELNNLNKMNTINNIILFVKLIFMCDTQEILSKYILLVSFFIAILFLLRNMFKNIKVDKYKHTYIMIVVIILLLSVVLGILYSSIYQLMTIEYFFVIIGCIWLLIAVLLSQYIDENIKRKWILVIFIIMALSNTNSLIRNYIEKERYEQINIEVMSSNEKEITII